MQRDASGSLQESTRRQMLPFLLSACGGEDESSSLQLCECPNYRAWGYLLVTSVCHRGAPSGVVREVLANTILDGAFAVENKNAAADALISLLSSMFKRAEKRAVAMGRALGHARSA